ncbi:MAG: glycosyl hydrolase family 18 [Pseudobutyrivibrio sp.]|nr:glycosyl hydrolase family 18 [Pseudobutyrivibrio sp.]
MSYRHNTHYSKRRKKRYRVPRGYIYIAAAVVLIMVLVVGIYAIKKYTPTKEHMDLVDYFQLTYDNQAAVILDSEYIQPTEDVAHGYAMVDSGKVYLELGFVKEHLDDGYVYDPTEITLRYATDSEVYTANLGSNTYSIDKTNNSMDNSIVIAGDDTVYILADYVQLLTDFQYEYFDTPSRVLIERAGYVKQTATAKGKSQIRNLNGPKSPILEDVEKGEAITVVRDTGKWSFVVSEKGVMGYMKNNKISNQKEETTEATLPERTYNHISTGKEISLLWHQVTSQAANADIATVLADSGKVNVISPTWFYLNDNKGGIASIASSSYVSTCHAAGVQVWGLISNLEDESVDTTTVLNTTSARDALVNNLIAQAITYGLDGINIDIEQLAGEASDGYIQFIKELSIKCEKNDIILSVDNYVPTASSAGYNRKEQAKYADYVIIMGYDEHYSGSEEAGSVASIGWVEQGVQDTLNEVPAEQVVLGMPFYCRVWDIAEDGSISSKAYGMDAIQTYLNTNGVSTAWDDASGQYYGEYVKEGTTYKIWVEDEASLEEKLKVMDKYGLAGGAFWKKGFDSTGAWNVIAKYL